MSDRLHFKVGNHHDPLDYESNTFDGCYSFQAVWPFFKKDELDACAKEMYRVLKPGGHFSISDVVLVGALPDALRKDAEMYAGCVAGAIQKDVYLELIHHNGFQNITVQKEKPIVIPDDILVNYLDEKEMQDFKNGDTGIFSVTVFAQKPMQEKECTPGGGCC